MRSGFTMVELMFALVIVATSVGFLTSSLGVTRSMTQTNKERTQALEAVQDVIESMRASEPSEVFARFNSSALDDPLNDLSPGDTFSIPGLNALPGDADGLVGQILFPGDGVQLLENVVDLELGMSRDLNLDGVVDGVDHALDYTILPVRVRAQWVGVGGPQQLDIVYVISER